LLDQGLKSIGKSDEHLARVTIQCGLQALNLGYLKASDIIPRILDVVGKYKEKVLEEYVCNSSNTPAWLFLRWISQIAAVLNRPESSIIKNTASKISSKYPQALFYPFKVIESNIELD
jgi:DNA-dependent protein kinase catalytic subunit